MLVFKEAVLNKKSRRTHNTTTGFILFVQSV